MHPPRSPLPNAALAVARAGHLVFPVVPNRKEPLTAHGFTEATNDTDVIRTWWSRWPTANIGMPTGPTSADVLDVDNHGPDDNGFGPLRRLRSAGLTTGAHRLIKTPRGGLHLYFRPNGLRNHSAIRHHIDVRGDGGYVLVPPSIVNGVAYEVLEDRPASTGVLDWDAILRTLDPPTWRRAHGALDLSRTTGNVAALTRWLSEAREGSRNVALFWTCCRMAEAGATNLADLEPLLTVAEGLGLPTAEAERTGLSALRRYVSGAA